MSNTNSTVKVSNYRPRAFAEVSKSKGEDSVLLAKINLDGVSSATPILSKCHGSFTD